MGRLITKRTVENPSYTDGLKYAEKEPAKPRRDAVGISDATGRRRGGIVYTTEAPKQEMARVKVEENIIARIGALCFIRKREPHHEHVAECFKNHYELAFGAGNPVGDPGRVQVDTSKVAHDSGIVAKIEHASKIKQAETRLGREAFDRLVACIILEIPAGGDLHWRTRTAMVDLVLSDLDCLAAAWKLSTPSEGSEGGKTRLEPAA